MMRKQTTSLQAYIHINISYNPLQHNTARRTQSEMVRTSLGKPGESPRGAGDSTSSSRIVSKRGALVCGTGAGGAGGAALTGVGAMTWSNSSVVGRRRAVVRMASAKC